MNELNFYEDRYLRAQRPKSRPAPRHHRQTSAPNLFASYRSNVASPQTNSQQRLFSSTQRMDKKVDLYETVKPSLKTANSNHNYTELVTQKPPQSSDSNLGKLRRITKSADNLTPKSMTIQHQSMVLAPMLWMRSTNVKEPVKQAYSCSSLTQTEKENMLNQAQKRHHNNKNSMDSVGNQSSSSSLDSGHGSSLSVFNVFESRRPRSVEPQALSPLKTNPRSPTFGYAQLHHTHHTQQSPHRSTSSPPKPLSPNQTQLYDRSHHKRPSLYTEHKTAMHSRESSLSVISDKEEKDLNYVTLEFRDDPQPGRVTNQRLNPSVTETVDEHVEYTMINFSATEAVRRATHEHKLYRDRMQWPDVSAT